MDTAARLLAITLLVQCGCSTILSKIGQVDPYDYSYGPRHGWTNPQIGNPYSGLRLNLLEWQGIPRSDPGLVCCIGPVAIPIMIIDLPCSIIGDTLFLPVDLSVKAEYPPLPWKYPTTPPPKTLKTRMNETQPAASPHVSPEAVEPSGAP